MVFIKDLLGIPEIIDFIFFYSFPQGNVFKSLFLVSGPTFCSLGILLAFGGFSQFNAST